METASKSICIRRILALLLILTGVCSAASALDIKLASVAPSNTPYSTALEQLAAEWERISGGSVRVIVYENGIAGNQADMLRKMRIGEIQGGLFASTGLTDIAPAAMSVSVPYLIQDNGEFTLVMKKLRPILDAQAESHGLKAVVWAEAGWAYLFSKSPVATPQQAKQLKLAVPPDQQTLINSFKAFGYRPVPIDLPETLSALNSGLVNGVFASPSLAAGYQWFGIANYMTDQKIAPVLGSVLINRRTWDLIPQRYRPQFETAARRIENQLQSRLQSFDARATAIMKNYGLRLVPVSPAEQNAWHAELERYWNDLVGPVFDRDTVNLIRRELAAYRSRGN
ncbi:MAG TPA: TRAP transporter substrate-binding protein DctP [Spirochaetia bacterium]|nr:TRAP transporter substrate-binding protein DctP [Spirochaetia bacterium]